MPRTLLLFGLLRLLPHLGTSNHFSYALGSRQFFIIRSTDHAQPSSLAPATCSSVPSSATASGGVTIPTNGTAIPTAPGLQDYTVLLVGYGTPAQHFQVRLETSIGLSLVRCKPCPSGACDPAFDTTQSSTFKHVPCGSSDCPLPLSGLRGEVVQDVLTLTPSSRVVQDFTFGCVDAPLREDMKEYPTAPAFRGLDTCYNFTGLNEVALPLVRLKFGTGSASSSAGSR
ncbi:hypothetical protein PR202_ga17085 [Eleusine coracana subsp. coracana]|uniref:Xylanase inhibitor N-terminal domain-containing protein n=1 Tax=Eleusine coracana subsp. coracana TaxID=191504 RepID=A0AAV5CP88_ELECO|nr:hypothetical protein PR202_ga17085 [Eleusine coracana subsp. coracana]